MVQTASGKSVLDILLVEDSDDNIMLIKAFLKKSPHRLHVAKNGEEGLKKVQQGECDLVFMDVQMPVMDGYSATQAIRAWEAEKGRQPLPIVALTAHALAEDVQKTLDAGCNEHLTKPVSKKRLLAAIERYS